jgi:mannose-6-phosphate isomerase
MAIVKLACIDHKDVKLSVHPDTMSEVISGRFAGLSLSDYIRHYGYDVLGSLRVDYDGFPFSIYMIDEDGMEFFSPDKAKLWLVLEADEASRLYIDVACPIAPDASDEQILASLNEISPHAGDIYFIEPGILAASGHVKMMVVEQNANITQARVNLAPGKCPEKVQNVQVENGQSESAELVSSEYFSAYKTRVDGRIAFDADRSSFGALILLDGDAIIECSNAELHANLYDSFFVNADTYDVLVTGNCTYLYVRM